MGQARLRGTKEQRVAEAIKRKHEQMGLQHIAMESIYQQFDLAPNAIPLGYLIRIDFSDSEKMKFLVNFKDTQDRTDFCYSSYPGGAYLFESLDELSRVARWIARTHETDICYLFETNSQYEVVPVITVDSPKLIDVS